MFVICFLLNLTKKKINNKKHGKILQVCVCGAFLNLARILYVKKARFKTIFEKRKYCIMFKEKNDSVFFLDVVVMNSYFALSHFTLITLMRQIL